MRKESEKLNRQRTTKILKGKTKDNKDGTKNNRKLIFHLNTPEDFKEGIPNY